ncbi:MAG: SagB/ThcOx family dehydrogenase [Candidatus Thermoplasmatota archaeon]|nr:SagB/ThcOx family dehydrogenase [Candidatus Thermoplasmatota archaeon]MBU1940810.1 SagB/ThcOx family dehydrogenase [Candidatus Thermoplasmatota archaeon]
MSISYGDVFQQHSKYHRHEMPQHYLDWNTRPPLYKTYPQVPHIHLPEPTHPKTPSLFTILQARKSVRNYLDESISKTQISQLLWATTGIRRIELGLAYRTAPSAGALYPIETYLVVNNVTGVSQGIYHYSIQQHQLEELRVGDFRNDITQAALDQNMCATASVIFVWTGVFSRSKWKYGQRAYRYVYLDCGHIAENLALTATGLGLGTCQIAALYDDEINQLLDIDGVTESVIYLSVVGHGKK